MLTQFEMGLMLGSIVTRFSSELFHGLEIENPSGVLSPQRHLLRDSQPPLTQQPICKHPSFISTLYTIYLFTSSDFKTIVIPKTIFGAIGSLSSSLVTRDSSFRPLHLLYRLPIIAFWVWINLLPFAIDNQRQTGAMQEDTINKPWRPLPSKRLTPQQARYMMLALYPVSIVTSAYIGGLQACIALILLGYCYNDLRAADVSCVVRNLINAGGYLSFILGAMDVAISESTASYTPKARQWFLLVGAVVFSTVHSQDFPDQEGDRARGRKTVPLVLGTRISSYVTAGAVMWWSAFMPWFWQLGLMGYFFPGVLGGVVGWRLLKHGTVKAHKLTFKIWNAWIVSLYLLPLMA